jgi:hypothetical protein
VQGAQRRRRWAVALSIAAAAGFAGWAGWELSQPDRDIAARSPARAISADARSPAPAPAPASSVVSGQLPAPRAATPADAIGGAPDLRRIYDQFASSADAGQRRIAARAFAACVPAFLPGAGQPASVESLVQALPAAQRGEREAAYRALYGRCSRFLDQGRADLTATYQSLQRDAAAREPGTRATQALLDGRAEQVDRFIAEATASGGDPAAIQSLSGLAQRLAGERDPGRSDGALMQTARAVDMALPAVACDMGLDCSANSLWSLQLCATEGHCQGDLLARLAARSTDDPPAPALVQQQRQRLLDLLRSGRALTSADLLP